MAERKYKHEEISAVPRGYRVRTVSRGQHEIRVAYPPGPRRRGAGRVVSILHPVGENPACPIRHVAARLVNPGECKCGSGEPAVFGGMCARCAREKAAEARKRAAKIRQAAFNGKKKPNPGLVDSIRAGDKVTILTPHGQQLTGRAVMRSSTGGWVLNLGGRHGTPGLADERNIVRVRKANPGRGASSVYSMALSLGYPYLRGEGRTARDGRTWLSRVTKNADGSGPAIFVGWDSTKREWVVEKDESTPLTRKNPEGDLGQAADLYREFHGREPGEVLEVQESELARKDYTALGDLVELRFLTPAGGKAIVKFSESEAVKVASSPNGRQLYLIGGNQDLTPSIADFGADPAKDLVDLGDAVFISYDASKWQTDFKPTIWEHKLGEESGVYPRGFFDKLKRRIFFAGGNYRIERPGIVD